MATNYRREPAQRDEQCDGCGYPFDTGQTVLAYEDGSVYCGSGCAALGLPRREPDRIPAGIADSRALSRVRWPYGWGATRNTGPES